LVLGGGYGRGEGGVLRTGARELPYNDLEFYVFVDGPIWVSERRYGPGLHRLAHRLTAVAGIEVEFKIVSQRKLRRSAPSMFYYDLVVGHRLIWGETSWLLACQRHEDPACLPLSEATRLLMNRCSGLLFARDRLRHSPISSDDADFVGRNLAKAELAFGDVVLVAFKRYHWSCRERHRRLRTLEADEDLPWLLEVRRHHEVGLQFKLNPYRTCATVTALERQFQEISALGFRLWMWLESRRLSCSFASARDYALSPIDKCPETNPLRNRLVNAKAFGPAASLGARGARHPRERVLHALALLLWEPALEQDVLCHVRKELGAPINGSGRVEEACQTLWSRFN